MSRNALALQDGCSTNVNSDTRPCFFGDSVLMSSNHYRFKEVSCLRAIFARQRFDPLLTQQLKFL